MNFSGVYVIRHVPTDRLYIGSSKNIKTRLYGHLSDLRLGRHHSKYLQRVWTKYGEGQFEMSALEECAPERKTLLEREQHYLDTLNPVFNGLKVAGSRLGFKVSAETLERMKQRVTSQETRDKQAAAKRGTTRSAETRALMSVAHTGRAKDPESIRKAWERKSKDRHAKAEAIRADLGTKTLTLIPNDTRPALRKLTNEQVIEIRNSLVPASTLCSKYNVSASTINKIRRGLIYRDAI